jgi:phosphatidylglycerophosphate synthase
MTATPPLNRRPLASRGTSAARISADWLLRMNATPDMISFSGVVFAAGAAAALYHAPGLPWLWIAAAVLIQLRLAANLLDGLVAVEGGRASALGPLWNEAPDRIEDALILVGFGLAAGAYALGLWAAVAALFCAYVRVLGGALGQPQSFAGPMAKQHRMAAITAGCAIGFVEALAGGGWELTRLLLWGVMLGTAFTAARRLRAIATGLRAAG